MKWPNHPWALKCNSCFGGIGGNVSFYYGCNILTNEIAQKEVDKSLVKLIIESIDSISWDDLDMPYI